MLRLVYSRFAAQEALAKKLEFEAEGNALQSVDDEFIQEVPDASIYSQDDQLIKRPSMDV